MLFGFGIGEVLVILLVSMALCAFATALAMESIALFLPTFLIVFPAVLPNFPVLGPNDAIGLVLIVMFFGQTSTLTGYWYRDQIDFRLAAAAVWITVPLAVVGRFGTYFVPEWLLLVAFSLLLFGLAAVIVRYHGDAPSANDGERVVFDRIDRSVYGVGGLLGGALGFATGELSNTTLIVRKGVAGSLATGTSTLVLYLTVLTANLTNLAIIYLVPIGTASEVSVPWGVALIAAPAFLVGGQLGSLANDRISSETIVRLLTVSYVLIGMVTLARIGV